MVYSIPKNYSPFLLLSVECACIQNLSSKPKGAHLVLNILLLRILKICKDCCVGKKNLKLLLVRDVKKVNNVEQYSVSS